VSQTSRENPQQAFERLREYCDTRLILTEIGGLKPTIHWTPNERFGRLEEKGVEGTISVSSHSPCSITVTLDIPFFLVPFKGILAESIRNHLARFA